MRYRINQKELKKFVAKHDRVVDKLLEDAFEEEKMLTIVLKHHFIVEFLVDKIFECVLDKPEIIVKKTFADKFKIFEAMGLDNGDEELRNIIWGLNNIRNEFAHNPKFDLWSRKGSKMIAAMKVKGKNNTERFSKACLYLAGYLETMWSLYKLFPLLSFLDLGDNDALEKDMWLKGSVAQKELQKEIERFVRSKKMADLIVGK